MEWNHSTYQLVAITTMSHQGPLLFQMKWSKPSSDWGRVGPNDQPQVQVTITRAAKTVGESHGDWKWLKPYFPKPATIGLHDYGRQCIGDGFFSSWSTTHLEKDGFFDWISVQCFPTIGPGVNLRTIQNEQLAREWNV